MTHHLTIETKVGHLPIAKVFDRLLFESPEICGNCYTKIRDVTETGDTWNSNHPDELRAVGAHGEYGTAYEPSTVRSHQPLPRRGMFCDQCGSEGGRARDRTLSKAELKARATPIVERLTEYGVAADGKILRDVIHKRKSDMNATHDDTDILREATEKAIRATCDINPASSAGNGDN